jgi:hypothetical protein
MADAFKRLTTAFGDRFAIECELGAADHADGGTYMQLKLGD